jgi:hypothetical protein
MIAVHSSAVQKAPGLGPRSHAHKILTRHPFDDRSGPLCIRARIRIRCRQNKDGVDLISDVVLFDPLWYAERNAITRSFSVIRVYDETGNVIETHEHAGEFKEP